MRGHTLNTSWLNMTVKHNLTVCCRFEGHMECPPGISHPSFSVNHSILEAVRPRLKDFHQLLLDPPKVSQKYSVLDPLSESGVHCVTCPCPPSPNAGVCVPPGFFILAEKCHKDNMGGAGPPRGKHQAERGQTGCQPVAEQHTQHQLRTH